MTPPAPGAAGTWRTWGKGRGEPRLGCSLELLEDRSRDARGGTTPPWDRLGEMRVFNVGRRRLRDVYSDLSVLVGRRGQTLRESLL